MKKNKLKEELLKIIGEMREMKIHLSAEEIYLKLKKTNPKVSLSTIYRNMDKLASQGVISKLKFQYNPTKYDANTESHPHIICINCGKVEDISINRNLREIVEKEPLVKERYKVLTIDLNIYGICNECKNNKKEVN